MDAPSQDAIRDFAENRRKHYADRQVAKRGAEKKKQADAALQSSWQAEAAWVCKQCSTTNFGGEECIGCGKVPNIEPAQKKAKQPRKRPWAHVNTKKAGGQNDAKKRKSKNEQKV